MSGAFWNYRLFWFEERGESFLEIREAHYAADQRDLPPHEAMPHSYSSVPATVLGDNVAGIRWVLMKMEEAAGKPVLVERDDKIVVHKEED